MAIRVCLANDYDIAREGLKAILSKNPIFNIVGEYTGNTDLYLYVDRVKPNILFIDMNLNNEKIYKSILKIKMMNKRMFIIAFFNSSSHAIDYINNENISGIFLYNFKCEEMYRGIYEMVSRGKYIQNFIIQSMENSSGEMNEIKNKINSLTKRELDILKQVATGLYNKEIATTFNITERTVKNHLSNIFKKLEVSDRTQATVFAIKNDLVRI